MDNVIEVLKDDKAIFFVNEEIYSLTAVMKTAYMFIEKVYIYFDYEKEKLIRVEFILKEVKDKDFLKKLVGEFYNELLNQTLRIKIFKETKHIRELILGRAFYNTCVEVEESSSLNKNIPYYEMNGKDEKEIFSDDEISKAWEES
ncbi:His-Xaa-Ser system protein HxsD [Clostridium drakei]|uniref:His-Xaa-Ser system protein HxsD n=1 Tax=Clostridium drakei TaxID=332101 RepID=A0A2U8DT47_9CLOT|nr:His-Xaa-Ser system protein HxsD [Clostridium drakei]AWI05953.1 His-Xaa-Ser system protein HxsD [Clostridium drakei]